MLLHLEQRQSSGPGAYPLTSGRPSPHFLHFSRNQKLGKAHLGQSHSWPCLRGRSRERERDRQRRLRSSSRLASTKITVACRYVSCDFIRLEMRCTMFTLGAPIGTASFATYSCAVRGQYIAFGAKWCSFASPSRHPYRGSYSTGGQSQAGTCGPSQYGTIGTGYPSMCPPCSFGVYCPPLLPIAYRPSPYCSPFPLYIYYHSTLSHSTPCTQTKQAALMQDDSKQQKQTNNNVGWIKRNPRLTIDEPTDSHMQIESKRIPPVKFGDLPDEVVFFLVDVYAYNNRLFLTGVLEGGQTISIHANQIQKQLYFCLKSQNATNVFSEQYLQRAQDQVRERLKAAKIQPSACSIEVENRQYVFEIQGVPRERRPYIKVRYSYSLQHPNQPKPDQEGETFKYVFGTSYTPLELFVVNAHIKGPCWVKVQKNYLKENNQQVERGLCAQIIDPQVLQPLVDRDRSPALRVLSVSLKGVVPAQLKVKQYFNTQNIGELHIYAISYCFCQEYQIDARPVAYPTRSRTFLLKEFGRISGKEWSKSGREWTECTSEAQMIAQFQADLRTLDPDVVVCHDASRVLDLLVLRLARLSERHDRPRLGRLIFPYEFSKASQYQRLSATSAGRLLVDTFVHAKDIVKSIEYQLPEMAKQIPSEHAFVGYSDNKIKEFLDEKNPTVVIEYVKREAEVTLSLMNHLQILQMTKKLSNICGIIWRRSIDGQRAQRNEYLIMHQCVRRELIVPDKFRKQRGGEEEDKKKYEGGYVIEPQKGLYSDFILLLDFNSLYPSIIREYNICFSKITRPFLPLSHYYTAKKSKDPPQHMEEEHLGVENVMPPSKQDCVRQKWGFLPQIIDKIVERRKKCKKAMENAPPDRCVRLDIQQKCYKLVANSIYGCLGFSISRFYSQHLAALITRMGRQALKRAKQIVQASSGVNVIYGDTDSLMIRPELKREDDRGKLLQLKVIADELKREINKSYSNLEIDIDGIFKPLLLLMKKKYVANKLLNFDRFIANRDDTLKFKMQYKGIEVVRRDGFKLARDVLTNVIDLCMKNVDKQATDVYEQIYAYIKTVSDNILNEPYRSFLFTKQLNKAPSEYARGQTIPHVKVALDRIKAGERAETLVHHSISYLVCLPRNQSEDTLAKRCHDDHAYERSQKTASKLVIDQMYYKKELMQPIGRILMHLPGFDFKRLCQAMGVPDQLRMTFKKLFEENVEEGNEVFDGFIGHAKEDKSLRLVDQLGLFQCSRCEKEMPLAKDGSFATNCGCGLSVVTVICNRIHLKLKQFVDAYYQNSQQCRCDKKFILTPMAKCCKVATVRRSKVPFQMHEYLYLCKEMCSLTLRRHIEPHAFKYFTLLQNRINKFLDSSSYQRIPGLKAIFNI